MADSHFFNQSVRAIIFDCDGTLIDSENAHFHAWQEVLQTYNIDLTPHKYENFVGKPDKTLAKSLAELIPSQSIDDLLSQKRAHFLKYIEKGLPPIEGTIAFVHRLLKEKEAFGLKLAVASAALKHEILKHLSSLGLKDSFDLILSGQDDLADYYDPEGVNKPKPYIYLHAAKLLGVLPSECVVLEDSFTGLTAGVQAGCLTVAIPTVYSKDHDFSKATLQIESLLHVSVSEFLTMVKEAKAKTSVENNT